MGVYFKRLKDEIFIGGSVILALVISKLVSKIFFIKYGDILLYVGSIIIVLGFLGSALRNDKIDRDKIVIVSGLLVMLLSCLI